MLRFYGASESAVAKALADAGGDGDGVEATICARDFEIHVDLLFEPGAEARVRRRSSGRSPSRSAQYLFARDERPVEELVLDLCRARGWSLATAESCTGGLVAARLTSVPGASDVFQGAVVAYANAVKEAQLGVAPSTLAEHGAVSAETAAADGRRRTGAARSRRRGRRHRYRRAGRRDPGEARRARLPARRDARRRARGIEFSFPSDRETIRSRATVAALHLLRRLLSQDRDIRV